jgi:hypothetical protein
VNVLEYVLSGTVFEPPARSLLGGDVLTTNGDVALECTSRRSHHLLEKKPLKLRASHDICLGDEITIMPLLVARSKRVNLATIGLVQRSRDEPGTANLATETILAGCLDDRELSP